MDIPGLFKIGHELTSPDRTITGYEFGTSSKIYRKDLREVPFGLESIIASYVQEDAETYDHKRAILRSLFSRMLIKWIRDRAEFCVEPKSVYLTNIGSSDAPAADCIFKQGQNVFIMKIKILAGLDPSQADHTSVINNSIDEASIQMTATASLMKHFINIDQGINIKSLPIYITDLNQLNEHRGISLTGETPRALYKELISSELPPDASFIQLTPQQLFIIAKGFMNPANDDEFSGNRVDSIKLKGFITHKSQPIDLNELI